MAILSQQLSLEAIQAFRGIVDVYCWKGLFVARAWPVWTRHSTSDKWKATWNALRSMHAWKKRNPYSWHHQWKETSIPFGNSYEDIKRKTGLALSYAGYLHQAPDVTNIVLSYPGILPETTITVYYTPYDTFDPDVLTYHVQTYAGKRPSFKWIPIPGELDRRGYRKYRYRPDTLPFDQPISCNVLDTPPRTVLVISGHHTALALYATPTHVDANGMLVSPPYYAEDYP